MILFTSFRSFLSPSHLLLLYLVPVGKKVVVPSPGPHKYHLETLNAPRVNGPFLKLFVFLLERPLLGTLLVFLLSRRYLFIYALSSIILLYG